MNDHTLDASVRVDLTGNLQKGAARNEQALVNMSRNGSRHLSVLKRTTASLDRTITRMGNKWVALATGGTIVAAGKSVISLQERFERLGIQANKSTAEMNDLKDKIFEVSTQSNIRIDPSELTSGIEELVEKTGDLQFAKDNLENIAMTISATGAEGKAIGGIVAEFQKMGGMNSSGVREILDILITQGKEGAFTLQNLAALGPRVVTSYTSMGRSGIQSMRELGAVLQVIRMSTGSSEQAATSFEAMMRVFSDANKVKVLQEGGIKLFDPEQLKKGKEVLRPVNDLMQELVKAAGGKQTILSKVLGDSEAVRAFKQAVTEFNMSGGVASLDKFMSIQADGTNLPKDSARAAKTAAAAIRQMFAAGQRFADLELAEPIERVANELKDLKLDDITGYLEDVKDGFVAVGVSILSLKAMKIAHSANQYGNSLTRAKASNGLGASSAAPIPVFVVNNMSGAAGDIAGTSNSSGSKTNPSKRAKAGKWASKGAGLVLGGFAAWEFGQAIGGMINKGIEGTGFHDWLGASMARTMAAFGNDEAQRAVAGNGDAHSVYGSPYASTVKLELSKEASRALSPKVDGDGLVDVSGTMGAR